jgi:predicted Zn-dependent protease
VLAGDTGEPVVGAQVVVAGRSYTTTATGDVDVDPDAETGLPVRVEQSGFLVRETVAAPPSAGAITLWPLRGAYSDAYVRTLLYKPSDSTKAAPSPLPDEPLMRIVVTHVSIVPSDDIRNDPHAMDAHRRAVEVVNAATEGRVTFTLDAAPTSSVVFRMVIDRSSREGAFTYRTLHKGAIIGGRVVFSSSASFQPARDVRYVAHELGHVLGLQHSTVPTDMMYFTTHEDSPETFTVFEKLTIKLLLMREPGNRYPDRDRALG